ncbi:MAG: hypothetical protein IJQ77_06875 [Synergistaceae bacterium]|nr:hypothetical protein [Synergistaceae bacterium]MBR0250789.1 hypothetical protein [Synergistaceae bacterium]
MTSITISVDDELNQSLESWSKKSNLPPEFLALDLLREYFDDCDDADRLEALIRSGNMNTIPAHMIHKELDNLVALGS